jgi:aminoglycoside 2'-N-acetyltransferase I
MDESPSERAVGEGSVALRLEVVDDVDLDDATREAAQALCYLTFADWYADDPDGAFTIDDWQHTCGGVRVLLHDGDELVAHAAVVPREIALGDEAAAHVFAAGYVEGVAVIPSRQRSGFGTLVMDITNEVLRAGFELGVLSTGSGAFYERLGWERWRGPSYVESHGARTRTADEDDGLVVLRCPASLHIDTAVAITCHERPGDDW